MKPGFPQALKSLFCLGPFELNASGVIYSTRITFNRTIEPCVGRSQTLTEYSIPVGSG